MMLLENPPENPCFGCGKANPRGLRLDFERRRSDSGDREVVACTFVPRKDEIGWPGLLHTGLHQFVLFEVSYWAALTLGGRCTASEERLDTTSNASPEWGAGARSKLPSPAPLPSSGSRLRRPTTRGPSADG